MTDNELKNGFSRLEKAIQSLSEQIAGLAEVVLGLVRPGGGPGGPGGGGGVRIPVSDLNDKEILAIGNRLADLVRMGILNFPARKALMISLVEEHEVVGMPADSAELPGLHISAQPLAIGWPSATGSISVSRVIITPPDEKEHFSL